MSCQFPEAPYFMSIGQPYKHYKMEGEADFNRLREERKFLQEQIVHVEDQQRRKLKREFRLFSQKCGEINKDSKETINVLKSEVTRIEVQLGRLHMERQKGQTVYQIRQSEYSVEIKRRLSLFSREGMTTELSNQIKLKMANSG